MHVQAVTAREKKKKTKQNKTLAFEMLGVEVRSWKQIFDSLQAGCYWVLSCCSFFALTLWG